ncbi:SPFH domain-containing protein [Spirillospora sp. NPDC047279]|uniref:SPFH domain-containing protein n=1 Tax=Spirillospora sp. NPDC047279 TaxID=3155478 RepID=UPI0033D84C1E
MIGATDPLLAPVPLLAGGHTREPEGTGPAAIAGRFGEAGQLSSGEWRTMGVVGLVMLVGGLVAWAVRVVPAHQRMVVFRAGKPPVVKDSRLVFAPPMLSRSVRVPREDSALDVLWLRGVTADGVAVTVNAAARVRVNDPVRYARAPRPLGAALLTAAESEIRTYIATHELVELSALLREPPGAGRRDLSRRISDRVAGWGAQITVVEFSRVQVRLDSDLLRWAESIEPRPGPRSGQAPGPRPAFHDNVHSNRRD